MSSDNVYKWMVDILSMSLRLLNACDSQFQKRSKNHTLKKLEWLDCQVLLARDFKISLILRETWVSTQAFVVPAPSLAIWLCWSYRKTELWLPQDSHDDGISAVKASRAFGDRVCVPFYNFFMRWPLKFGIKPRTWDPPRTQENSPHTNEAGNERSVHQSSMEWQKGS